MSDLIDTTEMYLRTILELEEEGRVPLRARIVERLEHSGPTVSQTIARMERDGWVSVADDRRLELTAQGRKKAVQVMRKHRLAERLLYDVIGLEWHHVHEEACRWEHVMSERAERRIMEIVEKPTHSPYGNLIPGLEELGLVTRGVFVMPSQPIMSIFIDRAIREFEAVINCIGEHGQSDAQVLQELAAAGLKPGVRASFVLDGKRVRLQAHGQSAAVELSREAADQIFVTE
ncbi:MAG: metal-dependent transcriptional regulator [Microbacteriaceae bacterium]|nr:metal-dependent transcriptional regulator [Microbacteriaceae bacterium]